MTSSNNPLSYYEKDSALDYQKEARQTYNDIKNQVSKDFRQIQSFYSRYREKKKTKRENQTPAEWAARQNVFATWAIAVLSAVTIGVGIVQSTIYNRQLKTMKDQLEQMVGSGNQTDSLIAANVKLSDAAKKSADTAADNLIATQRAYVGNTDASINAPILGTIVKGNINYTNSGKEPAKFEATVEEIVYTADDWNGGSAADDIVNRQNACLSKISITGQRYAWPSGGVGSYALHFPNGRIPQTGVYTWDNEMLNGNKKLALTGCITYLAFNIIHHTAFCYYYDASISDITHLNICNVGSDVN